MIPAGHALNHWQAKTSPELSLEIGCCKGAIDTHGLASISSICCITPEMETAGPSVAASTSMSTPASLPTTTVEKPASPRAVSQEPSRWRHARKVCQKVFSRRMYTRESHPADGRPITRSGQRSLSEGLCRTSAAAMAARCLRSGLKAKRPT
jgi:hypothetical protein